jgi:hypothetical protein
MRVEQPRDRLALDFADVLEEFARDSAYDVV